MFELRWLIRPVTMKLGAPIPFPNEKEKVLQFRQMSNIEEIGIQEPIWTEWEDVPTETSI